MQLNLNKLALALAAAGVIGGLAGCGGGGGGGPSTVINTPPVQISAKYADVTLLFIDAITGKPVDNEVKAAVTFQTPGILAALPDGSGQAKTLISGATISNKVNNSISPVGLLADFSLGSFTVTPDASSWIGQAVTVSKGSEGQTVSIKVLPRNFVGTDYSVSTVAANPLNPATITAAAGDTSISIPAAAVAGGVSSITAIKLDKKPDATWSNALPGASFSLGVSGSDSMARFIATDSNGNPVRNFSLNPVTLQIELSDPLDEYPGPYPQDYKKDIYSFDEVTKAWVNEGKKGKVDKLPDGKKVVYFTSNHLTIFALDYAGLDSCVYNQVALTGRPDGNQESLTVQIKDFATNGTVLNKTSGPPPSPTPFVTDNSLDLFWVPTFPVNLTISKTNDPSKVLYSGKVDNLCTPGLSLALDPSKFITTEKATLTVNVTENCKRDISVSRIPGPTNVQFLPTNAFIASGGFTDVNGNISITKVYDSSGIKVDLTTGTTGTLQIWNRFILPSGGWYTLPPLTITDTDNNPGNGIVTQVNMKFIELDCDIPTGTTGSTGAN